MIKKRKETSLNNFLKQTKEDGTNVQMENLALVEGQLISKMWVVG